ncbi:MAG TPA: LysR family transcriptional regulator [Burkholderiaceae bacterium]|nr:LysR family transcriptional regulator [Burkholderiaceae bacterium]
MTLKQLQAFYWASVLGSFALAAQRLHTTQSSLSKRIAELETDLGERLFDRAGSRARCTEAGERLLEHAGRMLELEDEIRRSAGSAATLQGVCRFGIGEFVAHTWLPAFVALVRAEHPQVALEPYIGLAKPLMSAVTSGELDFAIVPAPSSNASVEADHLRDVAMIWTAAPSLLGASSRLTRELFERTPVISLTHESGVSIAFEQWARQHRIRFQRTIVTNSMSAVAALTVAGVGLSLLAEGFVRPLVERGQLLELGCEPAMPEPPVLRYFFHARRDDRRWMLKALKPLAFREADFKRRSVLLP